MERIARQFRLLVAAGGGVLLVLAIIALVTTPLWVSLLAYARWIAPWPF
jgi:hypothetical protein